MPDAERRGPGLLQAAAYRGEPMVWLSAGALVLAIAALCLLLLLLFSRGMGHFWPRPLVLLELSGAQGAQLGEVLRRQRSRLPAEEGKQSGPPEREILLYRGAGERFASPLLWLPESAVLRRSRPESALRVERRQREVIFGFAETIRLRDSRAPLLDQPLAARLATIREAVAGGQGSEAALELRLASGEVVDIPLADVTAVTAPNGLALSEKFLLLSGNIAEFLLQPPRQFNAEGGVFPAIVGTVVLVLLMSVIVTPLGVLAAIYLQEYAQRGPMTRFVRIAVNNLAGVPSIVYGVFGLGFFVYGIGGSLDSLLFADTLPAPTLGTPGLLWASLTMALLTLPVVIVATEEGLARVPQSLREGSLALGATRAEALWRVVLPAASPALLTGLILAVARATGEVAPLILVGVAKYAPILPVSGEFPYLHLDQQFMHLGFHIYDLGFQNPRLELTTDRVFATALLLVLIVLLLNLSAVILRGRLREAFKSQDLV
jgi:phosphate transport system permease protein